MGAMVKCVSSRFVKHEVVKLVIFTVIDASTTIIVAQISNQRKDRH
jgi:signal recognition particle receptor subunit beta